MAWHKCQPVVPGFQRELTAKNKIGNWPQMCCKNKLTFSFALAVQLVAQFDAHAHD
jgi:hypothetical protein